MTSHHTNTSSSHTLPNDEQQKELRCFLNESRERFIKLLKRWSCGEELFMPSSNEAVTTVKDLSKASNPETTKQCEVPKQEKFPPSCASNNSLRITAEETTELLGITYPGDARNLEDLQVNYTPAQRLSLYTHILNKIPNAPKQKLNEFHGNADYDELNAFRTGASGGPKRRYRVSRPTFNEELRDLVELQMAALRKRNDSEQPASLMNRSIKQTCLDKGDNSVLCNKIENVRKMGDIERYKNEKKGHQDWAHQRREHYKHDRHKNSNEGGRSPSRHGEQRKRHRSHKRSRSRSRSRHSTPERRHHRHYTHNNSHSRNHFTEHNRHYQ